MPVKSNKGKIPWQPKSATEFLKILCLAECTSTRHKLFTNECYLKSSREKNMMKICLPRMLTFLEGFVNSSWYWSVVMKVGGVSWSIARNSFHKLMC